MTRLVFGVDRIPEPWEPIPPKPLCRDGEHLVDNGIGRCTECHWLDPHVIRCASPGCVVLAYIEDSAGTDWCSSHARSLGLNV